MGDEKMKEGSWFHWEINKMLLNIKFRTEYKWNETRCIEEKYPDYVREVKDRFEKYLREGR